LSLNAGKRSMSLDLKKPEAIELVKRLISTAHVIVENFRPGVMARMGLGYEDVVKIKPDIIYCSVTGYGQKGPDANAPAYDGAIQAASGIMSITGEPDGRPLRVGYPFSDASAGIATALAIAASLYRRLVTGKGQYIDLAMVDATLSMMSQVVGFWLIGGKMPVRLGNLAWSRKPTSDMFKTRDGYLMFVVNTEPQFLTFCKAIGRPDLPADTRFKDETGRSKNSVELRAEIENALSVRGSVEWERYLKTANVAVSRVMTIPDAFQSEQMAYRNLVLTLHGTAGINGPIRVLNAPYLCNEDSPGTDSPPPSMGEHNEEVLHELSLTEDDIAQLRSKGVFF
jgi:CoA:oxalate CoA-transferase